MIRIIEHSWTRRSATAAAVMALAILCGSCKKTRNAAERAAEQVESRDLGVSSTGVPNAFQDVSRLPGTVFQVTYTPNTVHIDAPTAQKLLRSISHDGRVMVLDASDSRVRDLKPGDVLFLEHLGVRRIVQVLDQGSNVAILTGDTALTDFIQDGHIKFSAPIAFKHLRARASAPRAAKPVSMPGFFEPLAVYASEKKNEEDAGSVSLQTGEFGGWEFELEGGPKEDGGLELTLDATKKIAGISASIKAKGEISHIDTNFDVSVSGGKSQNLEYSTPLQGKLDVSWSVLHFEGNSSIGEARLKLPPFAKRVLDLDGLPFLFQVDEALIFKPGFGGKKDGAEGGFHVLYSGSGGLSIQGDQSNPEGDVNGETKAEETTSESMAPHGVVLAINAPKISLSLGTESFKEAVREWVPKALLNELAEEIEKGPFASAAKQLQENFFSINGAVYIQLVTTYDYTGSGPLSVVPCTIAHLKYAVQVGADANLLALKAQSPKKTLKEGPLLTWRKPDIDACGAKRIRLTARNAVRLSWRARNSVVLVEPNDPTLPLWA